MNYPVLARVALTFLCAVQGISTFAIDLNKTHAANPTWTGHARFHVVWQSGTVFFLTAVELLLIWVGPAVWLPAVWAQSFWPAVRVQSFYLAALLAALSPLAFLAALLCRKMYGGTLSDPNGIPQMPVRLFGAVRRVDLNLVAVVAALVSLGAIVAIMRRTH